MFIIAYGNLSYGFTFVGPFATREEATEYGNREIVVDDWCISLIYEPVSRPVTTEVTPTNPTEGIAND